MAGAHRSDVRQRSALARADHRHTLGLLTALVSAIWSVFAISVALLTAFFCVVWGLLNVLTLLAYGEWF